METRKLLNYIEAMLNGIAAEFDFDIAFKGNLDVVNNEWLDTYFGIRATPFALAKHQFEARQDKQSIDFSYSLYIMPFSKDRKRMELIMNEFWQRIQKTIVLDDFNIDIRPTNIDSGNDFTSGSGLGFKRYETLITFIGNATQHYRFEHLNLKIDNQPLDFISFKYDHTKTMIINKEGSYLGDNNKNLNTNMLVLEVPLSPNNTTLNDFIGSGQRTNITKTISLNLNDIPIIDGKFEYEGHTLSSKKGDSLMVVYLYFTMAGEKASITINGEEIPILDFAITKKTDSIPIQTPDSNTIKHLFTSTVRSYAFNISEELGYDLFNVLENELLGYDEVSPIFDVSIKLYGKEIEKRLILDEISKESKDNARTIFKVIFVESGE